ncbi:hypothetical protein GmHk_05G013031 [Glycine max]|nr:hypothetical protein GmHk_05G013031 [Glycine max]
MEDTLTQFMQVSISNQKNIDASIKNLEVQVGQLAKQLSEHGSGSFSANTQGTVVCLKDNGEKKNKEGVEKEKEKNDEMVTINHPPVEHLPHLHAPSKKDKERPYKHFLDIFKRMQINIPFSEALEQMPTYDKFVRDFLTKNKRIMDDETMEPKP